MTETVTVGSGGKRAENRANQRDELRQRSPSIEKSILSPAKESHPLRTPYPSLGVGVFLVYPLENFLME